MSAPERDRKQEARIAAAAVSDMLSQHAPELLNFLRNLQAGGLISGVGNLRRVAINDICCPAKAKLPGQRYTYSDEHSRPPSCPENTNKTDADLKKMSAQGTERALADE